VFNIDRRAYVPNPETYTLVRHVLDYVTNLNDPAPLIVDVGTGCGNIAISLAKEVSNARVIGVDILQDSLALAQENALAHTCENIQFVEADLLPHDLQEEPRVIVADLPYGSPEYLLPSIDVREFEHMPVLSTFTKGLLDAYVELIQKIIERRWKTTLFFECGVLPINTVLSQLGQSISVDCCADNGYGVGRAKFATEPSSPDPEHELQPAIIR
jgi:release factor glutamine methyltransferase